MKQKVWVVGLVVSLLCGCASVTTTISETNPTNGVVRTTTIKASAFFEANSQMAKAVARNGEYTNGQYAGVSGVNLTATSSNVVTISESALSTLVTALAKTATAASTNK